MEWGWARDSEARRTEAATYHSGRSEPQGTKMEFRAGFFRFSQTNYPSDTVKRKNNQNNGEK